MNADDDRRRVTSEPGWLLRSPAGCELPEDRKRILKEHLMSELRLAGSRPADRPATRRRRRAAIAITAAGAAGAAAAIALTILPGATSRAPTAAAQLLAKIATAAAAQPAPAVRDSQFSYIDSWVAYEVCPGVNGSNCALEKPHELQVWQSVSNQCVTGLLREYGRETPMTFWAVMTGVHWSVDFPVPARAAQLHCRGGVHDPTYRFLQSLPTDPHALLAFIEREMQGVLPRPEEAFSTIGDLLGEATAPPSVSATLYQAAALIPGVTVVADATDAIGRHGVAVALTYQGRRTEWIFSKQTLLYLGERDVDVANGSMTGESAVLQRAFVDRAGQLPG